MVVASGTALFAAAVLSGCGSQPQKDHQGVCVNQTTQTRVDDDECDHNGGSSSHGGGVYLWRLFPRGTSFPAVGGKMSSYPGSVGSIPSGHGAVYGGGDTAGGTVTKQSTKSALSRGGFGKTSRAHGGSVGG
ncbi:hypothetical protein [Kineosporia sp. NBRC 101731]|uniref:hypothetical protein n=1 Tax=Kineosporia sp. NBRC 101731 TaxID=3032199 RepID=UPI0024A0ABF2|nr:hypothetical protein [Kineosporia sp. NBRC 101731]GLY32994.1 hypothetical protein Kisp02_63590 [Kineosporia sp. NBRC 101731]